MADQLALAVLPIRCVYDREVVWKVEIDDTRNIHEFHASRNAEFLIRCTGTPLALSGSLEWFRNVDFVVIAIAVILFSRWRI